VDSPEGLFLDIEVWPVKSKWLEDIGPLRQPSRLGSLQHLQPAENINCSTHFVCPRLGEQVNRRGPASVATVCSCVMALPSLICTNYSRFVGHPFRNLSKFTSQPYHCERVCVRREERPRKKSQQIVPLLRLVPRLRCRLRAANTRLLPLRRFLRQSSGRVPFMQCRTRRPGFLSTFSHRDMMSLRLITIPSVTQSANTTIRTISL